MAPKKKIASQSKEVEAFPSSMVNDPVNDVSLNVADKKNEPDKEVTLAPSLDDAFNTLSDALRGMLSPDDDYPNLFRVIEARKRYTDGHRALAWQHVIEILEGVLGKSIRQN